eukprot:PITA_23925
MANTTCLGVPGFEGNDEAETRKGPWSVEEDMRLTGYIRFHGEGRWNFLAKAAGLKRTGRSCRLRWFNSLRPGLKHGKITPEEERLIIELHRRWGNRWSHIARSLQGRTDNEIKNYWRTRIKGKLNLQVASGGSIRDVDRGERFEPSLNYDCLPTSSHIPPDQDGAEPSTNVQTQISTEDVAVQLNETQYLQGNISSPLNATDEVNDEYVLQGETRHVPSQTNDEGQPGAASQQDLKYSENQVIENSLCYNFSVGSLGNLLYSSEFCAHGNAEGGIISPPSWYMVASPEAFSDSEAYMNRYSDVLWNMDEEDDGFSGNKQWASRNSDRRSY